MFDMILLGVDGSKASLRAVEVVGGMARAPGDRVVVTHVRELTASRAGSYPVEPEDEADKLIADAVATLTAAGVSAFAEVRKAHFGRVAQGLVDAAEEHNAR